MELAKEVEKQVEKEYIFINMTGPATGNFVYREQLKQVEQNFKSFK